MAIWYSLWSFVIFFPIWNVWTKKNLATLLWATFSQTHLAALVYNAKNVCAATELMFSLKSEKSSD
jgi:hypothetical protein